MPAFEKSAGGTLTDRQIDSLVQGIFQPGAVRTSCGASPAPPYAASATGDPTQGQKTFAEFCARCHGADGKEPSEPKMPQARLSILHIWRWSAIKVCAARSSPAGPSRACRIGARTSSGPGSRAMTDQEITDVVAWLAAQRTAALKLESSYEPIEIATRVSLQVVSAPEWRGGSGAGGAYSRLYSGPRPEEGLKL